MWLLVLSLVVSPVLCAQPDFEAPIKTAALLVYGENRRVARVDSLGEFVASSAALDVAGTVHFTCWPAGGGFCRYSIFRCGSNSSSASCLNWAPSTLLAAGQFAVIPLDTLQPVYLLLARDPATGRNATDRIYIDWFAAVSSPVSSSSLFVVFVVLASLSLLGALAGSLLVVLVVRRNLLHWHSAAWACWALSLLCWGASPASIFLCLWATRRLEAKNWPGSSVVVVRLLAGAEIVCLAIGSLFGALWEYHRCSVRSYGYACSPEAYLSSFFVLAECSVAVFGALRLLVVRHAFLKEPGTSFLDFSAVSDLASPFIPSSDLAAAEVPPRARRVAQSLAAAHFFFSVAGSVGLALVNPSPKVAGLAAFEAAAVQTPVAIFMAVLFGHLPARNWVLRSLYGFLMLFYALFLVVSVYIGQPLTSFGIDMVLVVAAWTIDLFVMLYISAWYVVLSTTPVEDAVGGQDVLPEPHQSSEMNSVDTSDGDIRSGLIDEPERYSVEN